MAILFFPRSPMQCPACNSRDMDRSHRRGSVEYGLSVFAVYPFRCQACYGRFWVLSLKRQDRLTKRRVPMHHAPNPR